MVVAKNRRKTAKQNLKIRVFMIINGSLKNGNAIFSNLVRSQALSLENLGCEVVVGVVDNRTSLYGILQNILRLRREIIGIKPQLVHAQYGTITAAVASLIKRSLLLVVSFCGDDLLGTPNPGIIWRIREKVSRVISLLAAWQADVIIVKSNNLLQSLPETLKRKAKVLPNGVNMNWFHPIHSHECRSKLGWATDKKVILFNASENSNQNVKNLPLAQATFNILSHSLNVTMHVMSNANREEVHLMLNAADCLLVTSLHEGSPNIVKEAMACNLPVVSVSCGDVTDRLKHTKPGKVCPYDAHALAEAIQEVLCVERRSNGREQLMEQGLTAQNVAESLTRIYKDLQYGEVGIVLAKPCVD